MRQALAFTRIALLMAVLAILPACAIPRRESGTATPPLKIKRTRIEDAGQVCFMGGPNSVAVRGSFAPRGCYSTSASRPLEQTLSLKVDPDQLRIEFHTSFLIETMLGVIQTTDCSSEGTISFNVGEVDAGVYSIWIGNRNVGKLSLPSTGGTDDRCFGERL
jgi:hypothetical protein